MTKEVASIIGSGTLPYTRGILPESQRGNEPTGEGVRTGIQVMVGNPEDAIAVDAFATSGVSIGAIPVKIWGPNINSLPRQRFIRIHNDGPGQLFIGPNPTSVIAPSGMHVHFQTASAAGPLQAIDLPFLHNVEIWGRALGAGGCEIRILAY